MSLTGDFFMLQNKTEEYNELRTQKNIQTEISKGKYIPPAGHVSIMKRGTGNNEENRTVIFLGQTDFSQGKQFGFAEDLFNLDIQSNKETFSLDKVKQVKSFSLTSAPNQVRMEATSAIHGCHGAALVDMDGETENTFNAIMFGGQLSGLIRTDNRLFHISGENTFDCKQDRQGKYTKISNLEATVFPAKERKYEIYTKRF